MPDRPIATLLPDLHLLTVLSATRSFTQAARRLGVSKGSVSTRIAELERAVGVALVRRTTRSVVLTEAGQQLVEATAPSFTHIEQCFSGARDLAGQPRGRVRLTAPVALGRQVLAPLLMSFLQRHPDVRLELELTDRLVNLAQEGFDLAVRHTHAAPDTHVAWVLCESRSRLVARADYLRRRGTPAHPAELAAHDCLLYLRDGPAQRWSFELMHGRRRGEQASVSVNGPLKVNNSEVLREAVQAGLGIGLLPDFSADASLEALLPAWKPVGFFGERIYAMRPRAAHVPSAVQALVEHLRQGLAAGLEPGSSAQPVRSAGSPQ